MSICPSLLMGMLLIMSSMLAVMTMNVGYFVAILGGIFIGELAVGRYSGGIVGH